MTLGLAVMTEPVAPTATLAELVDRIASTSDGAVRFIGDDFALRPGYHVTEIKLATIRSIDCGGGTDRWDEAVIELLDGPDDERTGAREHMPAAKLAAISRAAVRHVPAAADATPVFEFGVGALRRYRVAAVERGEGGDVTVRLAPLTARCKAFDRVVGRQDGVPAERMGDGSRIGSRADSPVPRRRTCC